MLKEIFIGTTRLTNPICVAASPHIESENLSGVGAIFTKTITLNPMEGNSGQVDMLLDDSVSMLNRVGLRNEGLRVFVKKGIHELRKNGVPVFVSIYGDTVEEIRELVAVLVFECGELISGIELNLSCPNVGSVPLPLDGYTTKLFVGEAVKYAEGIPVIAKLPPWPDHILPIARGAIEYGAAALSAVNTIKGLSFVDSKPFIGGMSGEALKPIALRCVYELANEFNVPIIGVGGVRTLSDVSDFFNVGARAVQVGTAEMLNPGTARELAALWQKEFDAWNTGGWQ